MRTVWAAAFLLRRLRVELGVVLLIVGLVGVTSFLFAAAPRLFNLVADEGVRVAVHDAAPAAANIELSRQTVLPRFNDPLPVVVQQGENQLARFPGGVRALVTRQSIVATSPRFAIVDPPRFTAFLSVRHQDTGDGDIEFVAGRMPSSTGERLPSIGTPDEERLTPRIEVAVSEASASLLGVEVGDMLEGAVDATDPLIGRPIGQPLRATFEFVGVFRVPDPGAAAWYGDARLIEPGLRGSVDNPIAFATALIAPDAFADVVASDLPFRYEWRYFVDPERIDAGTLEALVPDLRRLTSEYGAVTTGQRNDRIALRSGLLAVIQDYQAERAASEAVLSIAAIGPVALAAGAIAMSAVLLVARRRPNLLLARDRGASRAVILGAQLWEAALVAGAAVLAGLLLAVTLVPGRGSSLSTTLALATGLGAVAVLVAATVPVLRRAPDHPGRDEPPPVRTSPRRFVLELTAVGVALGGIGLLQQRGLSVGGSGGDPARFDPFLAAVPLLTGLAAGIVATRLYPLPIRLLGWLAARRRDLVPVLGLRNVGRRPSFATLPLLILMLTAAFGAFSSVVMASIDRGQEDASWAGVGADYRIEAEEGSLAGLDLAGVPGIEAVAAGYVNRNAVFESGPGQRGRIAFHAIEPRRYDDVIAGSRVPASWPGPLVAQRPPPAGTPDDPVPAILSVARPGGSSPIRVGSTFGITVNDLKLTMRAVDVRPSFPGIAPGTSFVVAPYEAIESALRVADAPQQLEPNVRYVRGEAALGEALAPVVEAAAPSATVNSRHEWYAGLRDAPLIAVVASGFRLALLVAGVYAALAVLAALTLTAARRTQDLAFLRTLGLSAGQATGVTIVEHGIPVVVALVPGVLTGVAVAGLLEGSLGLEAFIGPEVPFRIHVDWAGIALVAFSLIMVVAIAIAISTWLARRARTVDALRVGEA